MANDYETIEEWLAINVMGDEAMKWLSMVEDWNPRENLNHAMMLLDKTDHYKCVLGRCFDIYTCGLLHSPSKRPYISCADGKTRAEAITLAVARAAGCPEGLINE